MVQDACRAVGVGMGEVTDVLVYGPDAEVLGPPEIRELVREVAEGVAAAHG